MAGIISTPHSRTNAPATSAKNRLKQRPVARGAAVFLYVKTTSAIHASTSFIEYCDDLMTRIHPRDLLLAISLLVPAAGMAQSMSFERYYPNRVNQALVFEYSAVAEGERQQSYEGSLTRAPAGRETRDGATYDTVEHTTEGLPEFYPRRWKTYHRESEDGLYSGQLNESGRVEEYLEFPASAEPGESWGNQSAFWQSESFALVPRVETGAGTFENCIRVERFREDQPSGQKLTNTTTYCPGVSAVHSTVEHVAREFRSVTELSLVEVRD